MILLVVFPITFSDRFNLLFGHLCHFVAVGHAYIEPRHVTVFRNAQVNCLLKILYT